MNRPAIIAPLSVFDFFEREGLTPAFLREVSQHQVGRLRDRFDALDLDPAVVTRDQVPLERLAGFLALRAPRAAELCQGAPGPRRPDRFPRRCPAVRAGAVPVGRPVGCRDGDPERGGSGVLTEPRPMAPFAPLGAFAVGAFHRKDAKRRKGLKTRRECCSGLRIEVSFLRTKVLTPSEEQSHDPQRLDRSRNHVRPGAGRFRLARAGPGRARTPRWKPSRPRWARTPRPSATIRGSRPARWPTRVK